MHSGRLFVIHLHAVHPYIALPCFRIACNHARQRDETAAIFRPALQNGKVENRELSPPDHLFAWTGLYFLWEEPAEFRQHRQHFDLIEESMRTLHVHEDAYSIRDLVKRVGLERKIHPARGTELVDQNPVPGMTFHIFEQDRRTARG